MNIEPRTRAFVLCLMLVLPLMASAQAEGQPSAPSITTSWTDDGASGVRHAYTLTFANDDAYEINGRSGLDL